MIGLGLKQLQQALHRKADEVQREFAELSEELDQIGKEIIQVHGEESKALRARQMELRERQQVLAAEINVWRERSRAVLQQGGLLPLRKYLEELGALNEGLIQPALEHVNYLLDAPEEELARMAEGEAKKEATTPAARLIERARTTYEMRTGDLAYRLRAAVEFANRPGMVQDDATLEEVEAHLEDLDPIVREVALLTALQIHRFRAMRLADLDMAHKSVEYLTKVQNLSVVPILIEILEKGRTGFRNREGEVVEGDNEDSRMAALLRLVEWHTGDAQAAIRARLFDRSERIVKAAARALEVFTEKWTGPSSFKRPQP